MKKFIVPVVLMLSALLAAPATAAVADVPAGQTIVVPVVPTAPVHTAPVPALPGPVLPVPVDPNSGGGASAMSDGVGPCGGC
ncbi:hypothetical protein [Deinococcus aquaticus]|uniref:Secreted protein n=1 Tax=Deinococcus aquaticus TaxID=328692 RepID=A0ABY7V5Y5_9DEIO|nr:hypothetical protein [Deinococcus aquaticus]WDA60614.1 hypothetical protein M8445_16745 [Deinococcus aquaticus]